MPIAVADALPCTRSLHTCLCRGQAPPESCPRCKGPYWDRKRGGRRRDPRASVEIPRMPIAKVKAFQCNRCGHTWLLPTFPRLGAELPNARAVMRRKKNPARPDGEAREGRAQSDLNKGFTETLSRMGVAWKRRLTTK